VPFQNLQGQYQLEIRRGTEYGSQPSRIKSDVVVGATVDTNANLTVANGLLGDANHLREQGQFIIESNLISNAGTYGISIDAARDGATNAPNPGAVLATAAPNSARLVPGVVVTNNVMAASGTAGILFSGESNTGAVPTAAVPFGRITNNTIVGGTAATGTGIVVNQNAGPTLLNNLFANLSTGITVDASSSPNTIVGTSAYWNTATPTSGTTENQAIKLDADPFVNSVTGNYYLRSGSQAIDSGLNSLADRPVFTAVKTPLGIPDSPLIAPERDLFGQLRDDDPNQASQPGLGSNVFKDRGAIDRVDFTQPMLLLLDPLDNGTSDTNPSADAIGLVKEAARSVTELVLQLNDSGVGMDRATVTKDAFTLTRNGIPLVEGTDYLFRYFENNNRVVFEAAAVFSTGDYVLTATTQASEPGAAGKLTDLANNTLLPNKFDGTTSFAITLSDVPSVPANVVATAGDATVAVSWDASLANNSPLVQYEVEYRTFAGVSWTSIPVGLATSTTVTGLSNGTAYVFRVRAVNGIGNGDYSAESAPAMPLPPPTLALAADTGSSVSDGITNIPSVTVAGLFVGATWESSINGGNTWTAGVGSTFTLPAGTYAAGAVEVRQLLNGFASSAVSNSIQWVVDQTAPVAPVLALGTGVANVASAAEATQNSGVVTVSGESGSSIAVTFSRGANSVTKTVTGTGAAQAVVLLAGDLVTLGDGTINVSAVPTDLAGNVGPAGTTSFTLDTVAPLAPSLALGIGVANGATAAEAIQDSGVVTVSGESGASIAVTFTRGANSVTKTVPGTGAAQAVVLTAGDLTTLGNGTISVSGVATDVAGNAGPAGTTSFILDTVAPVAPVLALGTGVAAGATAAEATQLTGVVTVSGESGASIAVTFTRGVNSVTKTVTGTGAAQAVVLAAGDLTTLGNGTISVSAVPTDLAGNVGPAGTTSFTLDSVAPLAPSLALGTGVANGATAAEAIQASGVVTVSGESGASIAVTFTRGANSVTKTVTGTGAAQAVVLAAGDLTTLGNGTISVSAVPTDLAGNVGPAGTTSFTLDTIAPLAPSLALGTGVANGATAAEATQGSGVVTVNGESGASIAVTFTRGANSVTKTVTGTGSAQAVVLAAGDLTTLGNGTISVSGVATDVAGNAGPAGTTSFTLDSVAPTIASFTASVADGTYVTAATIPLVATLSEQVQAGGSIAVTLNTNAVVILTAAAQGNVLTGSYVVSPGETTSDLNIVSYTIVSAVSDVAGNLMTSTALPAAPGQLATVKQIVINGAITATANGFSTNAAQIADKRIAVRVIPITFTTPVRGVTLANFRLFYNNRSVSLAGAKLTGSGANYTLTLPVRATNLKGLYTLRITPNARIVAAANGAIMTQIPQIFWGYGRSVGMTPTPRALAFSRR
jgi:hypothetical protein